MKTKNKSSQNTRLNLVLTSLVSAGLLAASTAATRADEPATTPESALKRVRHIVVIYQENWSFDSLYGQFPGADGPQNGFDTLPQADKASGYSNLLYAT